MKIFFIGILLFLSVHFAVDDLITVRCTENVIIGLYEEYNDPLKIRSIHHWGWEPFIQYLRRDNLISTEGVNSTVAQRQALESFKSTNAFGGINRKESRYCITPGCLAMLGGQGFPLRHPDSRFFPGDKNGKQKALDYYRRLPYLPNKNHNYQGDYGSFGQMERSLCVQRRREAIENILTSRIQEIIKLLVPYSSEFKLNDLPESIKKKVFVLIAPCKCEWGQETGASMRKCPRHGYK